MKINKLTLFFFIFQISTLFAQEKTILNLSEAISIAIKNSTEVRIADKKLETKNLELQSVKNNQYPDFKISGQYMRLTNANVDLKSNQNTNNGNNPKVNQLLLAQANISMPLFAGFKIQNSIEASRNLFLAEKSKSLQTKEEIAIKVIENYANLYRAQKSASLITESLKSAQKRVADFINLEKNGIIARNDLLKVQLQESRIQLSLEESTKTTSVLNYSLTTLLKLPENYVIGIDENQFGSNLTLNSIDNTDEAIKNRKDLETIHYIEKANQNTIKIAKSGYYPSISILGGYTALDLQNVATVTNALNVGLGVSYNLSSILKNGKEVKIAKNKEQEIKLNEDLLTENIKIQVYQSREDFNLALNQKKLYEQAIGLATENFRIVKDKYDNGLANTNELLEADVEQLNSKINQAYAKANIMLKYYEMQLASGLLTKSLNLTK